MKIGAMEAMRYLGEEIKLCPYFLHVSSDLDKIR